MIDPHSRTDPPGRAFDPETVEAMSRAYQAARRKLGLADRDDLSNDIVTHHVMGLAQAGVRNPTTLYRLTVKEFKDKTL
ncbi:MAG: hypothetical protein WCD69_00270 [Xanthobacteraceae bacterium]